MPWHVYVIKRESTYKQIPHTKLRILLVHPIRQQRHKVEAKLLYTCK